MDTNGYDVIIVGGGAAGLSAALVLSRARRSVVVLDAGSPRNAPAAHMQGFLSRDGMPPSELLAAGRREVESYGGTIVAATVRSLTTGSGDEPSFIARLEDGTTVELKGNEEVEYDGEMHTAANLYEAMKEGYYGKF